MAGSFARPLVCVPARRGAVGGGVDEVARGEGSVGGVGDIIGIGISGIVVVNINGGAGGFVVACLGGTRVGRLGIGREEDAALAARLPRKRARAGTGYCTGYF